MLRPRASRSRAGWVSAFVAGAILTVFGGVTASAEETGASAPDRSSPSGDVAKSPGQVEAYWTEERMRNAKPITPTAPDSGEAVIAGDTATGPPGFAGGGAPGSSSDDAMGIGTSSTGTLPGDGGFPGPHSTWEWFGRYRIGAGNARQPIAATARVFFTTPSGGSSCSGSVIFTNAAEPDRVWTAGHCVSPGNGGAFYTNWLVCPSYDNGVNPAVGCWAGDFAQTTPEWFNNRAFSRDYATIDVNSCGTVNCTNIVNVAGELGFAWNQARDQHWMMLGYPAEPPFNGGKIYATAAEHRFDEVFDNLGPAMNSAGGTQNGGSSGGPWIVGFSKTGGFINSNFSLRNVPSPVVHWWGPYFDGIACQDMKAWTAWSGTC